MSLAEKKEMQKAAAAYQAAKTPTPAPAPKVTTPPKTSTTSTKKKTTNPLAPTTIQKIEEQVGKPMPAAPTPEPAPVIIQAPTPIKAVTPTETTTTPSKTVTSTGGYIPIIVKELSSKPSPPPSPEPVTNVQILPPEKVTEQSKAQTVHDLFAAREYAETPSEKAAIQLAIDKAAHGTSSNEFAQPVKDTSGKVVGVVTAPNIFYATGAGSGIAGGYYPLEPGAAEKSKQPEQITMTIPGGRIPNVWQEQPVKAIPQTPQSIIQREYAKMNPVEALIRSQTASFLSFPQTVENAMGDILSGKPTQNYYQKGTPDIIKANLRPSPQVMEWEYQLKGLSPTQKFISVQSKYYEDIIIPLATGAAFKYISLGAKAAKAGSIAAKGYKYFVNPAQKIIQYGVVPATLGTEIGVTAATNPKALGTLGGKTALQFALMGVGYQSYKPTAPKVEVIAKYGTQGKVQEVSVQKYVDVLGKQINYGKQIIVKPKVSTGLSQFTNLERATSGGIDYLKPIKTGEVLTPITGKYTRPSIDQFPNLKRTISGGIEYLRPVNQGKVLTPISGEYTRSTIEQFPNLKRTISGGIEYLEPIKPGKVLTPITGKYAKSSINQFPNLEQATSGGIDYLKPIKSDGVLTPVSGKYTKPNINQFPNLKRTTSGGIEYLESIKPSKVLTPIINNKIVTRKIELTTNQKWLIQDALSTEVLPKPSIYEQPLSWYSYMESGRNLFETEPIVSLKATSYMRLSKPKIFTFKDIIKEQEIPKGSQISGGRLKTITIQEQKIKTESKTLQVYKTVNEKQYLETMLQQKLEYKTYQEPILKSNLSFEEPTYVYTSLSAQQQIAQPKINQQRAGGGFTILDITPQATSQSLRSNQIISQDLISNQFQKNIDAQMQDIYQGQSELQLPRQDIAKISLQDIIQLPIQDTTQWQIQSPVQLQRQMQDQMQQQLHGTSQYQTQNQIQEQMQEQIQDVIKIQVPEYTYETKQEYKFRKRPEDDIIENMARIFKGYNVLIKEQYIFGGVKTKYPEFKKINIKPTTKESAYSLLATHLKQTARASGKIVEVETMNRPISKGFDFKWVDVSNEFYKKQGIIIQKASHRIGTSGEKAEITYKGIQARRRR